MIDSLCDRGHTLSGGQPPRRLLRHGPGRHRL